MTAGRLLGLGQLATAGRSAVVVTLASVAGVAMFTWPLLLAPGAGSSGRTEAPLAFALVLPVLLAVVVSELTSGRLDTKGVAMLGVLSAIGGAARLLGAGVAGVEPVFVLLVLAGRVYGPAFGFVLGSTTLFASALMTAGVGPWLPFQMMAASWVGMGAGLLPRVRGRREVWLLAAYGVVAAYGFGLAVNLWFWPFVTGADGALSFVPGAEVLTNLRRFLAFTLATSTWGWDTGRALTTAAGILVLGPALLLTLRRASRRGAFLAAGESPAAS